MNEIYNRSGVRNSILSGERLGPRERQLLYASLLAAPLSFVPWALALPWLSAGTESSGNAMVLVHLASGMIVAMGTFAWLFAALRGDRSSSRSDLLAAVSISGVYGLFGPI